MGDNMTHVRSIGKGEEHTAVHAHDETQQVTRIPVCYRDLLSGKYIRGVIDLGKLDEEQALSFFADVVKILIQYRRLLDKCIKQLNYDDLVFVANSVVLNIVNAVGIEDTEEVPFCSVTRSIDELMVNLASVMYVVVSGILDEMGKKELVRAIGDNIVNGDLDGFLLGVRSIIMNYLLRDKYANERKNKSGLVRRRASYD